MTRERVVLGWRDDGLPVGFRWSGNEPAGLYEPALAEFLGAVWEGPELVTYDLPSLAHDFEHLSDTYVSDPD
ncbi:MAG TPA: hypothetical protein VFD01_18615 [Candidatus Dormibacteraeota bacterium]|jgi:hypothetical protein|nr:hypothetical protein [Candidatus Dormibacteraeota bacterium]